ncbi:MAG TPA: hypothetical protein VKA40_08380 [Nitrososphaera sp.]|nr:hypothetical protein [Nitrososphaera sp.]
MVRYRRDLGVLSYMQAMDAITEMTNITAEIGEYKTKEGSSPAELPELY